MKELTSDELELIKRINEKISILERQSRYWFEYGAKHGEKALKAKQEIDDLKLKREDIINGTNKYKIKHIELEILRLKAVRDNVSYLKKKKYDKAIQEQEEMVKELKKRNID